jgi:DNA (cytosine-5)-methyltransferase 1
MKKLKTCSLFCWCWGSDLWIIWNFTFLWKKYSSLPVSIVSATDIDTKAVATYNENFDHKAEVKSISDLRSEDVPEIDLLVGWFPCQSFSTVNPNKDPFDERGQLYIQMARILWDKKPKFFIAENVKGLMVLKKGEIFKKVIHEFESKGYNVSFQLVNAADFWVPQKRQRVFIVWVRKDLGFTFAFPESTHNQEGIWKKKWVWIEKIIDKSIPEDSKFTFSEKAVLWMKNAKNNMKRGLAQDLWSPCLTVTSHLAKVSLNSRDPVLLINDEKEIYRRFTPREASRIQSFPDTFKFAWSDANAYKQIGNAIAPVVIWHIMDALIKQMK